MICFQTDSEDNETEVVELSSEDLGDLLEKAVSRAQQRRGLFRDTLFNRINIPDAVNDPFSGKLEFESRFLKLTAVKTPMNKGFPDINRISSIAWTIWFPEMMVVVVMFSSKVAPLINCLRLLLVGLYIGSLGPHSAEVVHLQRKYGNWQTDDTFSINQDLQCFEYVEAVKLTGDVNVPAGQVLIYLRLFTIRITWNELQSSDGQVTSTETTVLIRAGVFSCASGKRQSFAAQGCVSGGAWCRKSFLSLLMKMIVCNLHIGLYKYLLALLFPLLLTRIGC